MLFLTPTTAADREARYSAAIAAVLPRTGVDDDDDDDGGGSLGIVSGAGTGVAAAAKIGVGVGFVDVAIAVIGVGVGLAMGVVLFVKGEATGEVLVVVVELPPPTYIFPFRIPWLDPE